MYFTNLTIKISKFMPNERNHEKLECILSILNSEKYQLIYRDSRSVVTWRH